MKNGFANGPMEVHDGDRLVMTIAAGKRVALEDVARAAGKTDGLTYTYTGPPFRTPDGPLAMITYGS